MAASIDLRDLAGSALRALAAALAAAVASALLLMPLFADASTDRCGSVERLVSKLPGIERVDGPCPP